MAEKKTYAIDLCKRYEVTFVKNGAVYKAGDTAMVGMVMATKLYREGKIKATTELLEDAKKMGGEELFAAKKTKE